MIQTMINNQIESLCIHNKSLIDKNASTGDITAVSDSIIKMAKLLQEIQNDELNDPSYSVEKVAQMLNVGTQKVRELCRTGEIVSYRTDEGALIKIRASKYNEFVMNREAIERKKVEERNAVIELQKNRKNTKVNQVS